MTPASVRLGFIGYGIMGERLLRAALDHDPAVLTVTGVWDPSAPAMTRLQADLPQVTRLASSDAVIAASDCLYIASPPASHLAYARAAFAKGLAVFCEKPLAVDVADAEAFVAEAQKSQARCGVNFPFASSFAVDQLRAWMAEGVTGDVQRIDIEIGFAAWPRPWQVDAASWLDARAQGGFTREVGSHFLFLARRLFGPLSLLSHSVAYPEAGKSERSIAAALTAGSLPVALSGMVGDTDKPDHNIFRITGPNGAIRLRDWSIAEKQEKDGSWREAPDALPNEKMRPLVLRRQLDKVAALTRGTDQDLAKVSEAAEVQRVVETVLKV
ncbi:Gfo/Idh/MocA family oxidoreductase [Ferrovibrio terrae]|uniref:Gfo/Idh/MocA family oxidoreductase n=1 Tax=Ferrovibrio terrae TaxID=2594003 RepID=A0A516GZM4_9PROT|nr:Gfo/Idh/MocA family oxidoreductase [Ferrovibrio terrae]QDO96978.1 Gfo/Idh/MocA family oxidoreductase [Ferrovibrio terrae]